MVFSPKLVLQTNTTMKVVNSPAISSFGGINFVLKEFVSQEIDKLLLASPTLLNRGGAEPGVDFYINGHHTGSYLQGGYDHTFTATGTTTILLFQNTGGSAETLVATYLDNLMATHHYTKADTLERLVHTGEMRGLANRFNLYNGKELDESFGLDWYSYGARMYDPQLGRWNQIDPMSDKRNWLTLYNYVQNNPLLRIDPTGAIDIFYINNDGTIERFEQEGAHQFYVERQGETNSIYQNDYKLVATLNENANGLVNFPASGNGFNRYGTVDAGGTSINPVEEVGSGDHYVTPETAAALFGVTEHSARSSFNVDLGDMSSSNGSDPWQSGFQHHAGHGHLGNRSGLDVDFRYLDTSGNSFQSSNAFGSTSFSATNNQSFFDTANTFGFTVNYQGTNGTLNGPTSVANHNDHGHIGRINNNANITAITTNKPVIQPIMADLNRLRLNNR